MIEGAKIKVNSFGESAHFQALITDKVLILKSLFTMPPTGMPLKRPDQRGINMVDLMMWLVIAALLLAAAIQGIGYYQKAAYLYQMQSDLDGIGTIATGVAAKEDGKITKAVADEAVLEGKRSTEVEATVNLASDGVTPYLRATHPGVDDKDVLYLFDACSDTYKIGVNVVPKGGTATLEDCGISTPPAGDGGDGSGDGETPPAGDGGGTIPVGDGGGTTPGSEDSDGDGTPNSTDTDIDGDGTPNDSDPDRDGDGIFNGSDPDPINPPAPINPIGRTTTLQIAGFGAQWTNDLATGSDESVRPTDTVLQGALSTQQIYLFSTNTASYHQCAVGTLDRDLYCWGSGNYGQIGDGGGSYRDLPAKVTALADKTISQVAAGGNGTCAIADNHLYCWGDGWLTAGSDNHTPVEVGAAVFAGRQLTELIVGNQFGCVLADGTPYCWGTNGYGQLGNGDGGQHPDGARKTSATPVPVVNTLFAGKTVTALGASSSGACAIASGSVYCWGNNYNGQLGNGATGTYVNDTPVAVSGAIAGKDATVVGGSYSSACAIADGALYCWGGDYTSTSAAFGTAELGGKTVTALGFGDSHTCVIASDQPYCWGDGESIGMPSFTETFWDPWAEQQVSREAWDYYETPQHIDNGLFTGKKVLGLWSTAASNFVNYIK